MRHLRLAAACLLLSACLWRGYAEILRVHLDVLSGEADKVADNAAAGHRPTSNDVTELTYPLQRARQFVAQASSDASHPSYPLFVAALDRYQALVDAIDSARGDQQRWDTQQPRIATLYEDWRAAAARVREALQRER